LNTSEANEVVDLLGRQTKIELSNRGKLETVLFPNSLYEGLAAIEIFYRYPEFVRKIREAMSPEEIGRFCRRYGGEFTTMPVWTVGFEFLWGRQLLLTLGEIAPGDFCSEALEVLDFWKRLNLAYRRDGFLCNGQAGYVNPLLTRDELVDFYKQTIPLDNETKALFRRLHAKALSLLILTNCESRAKYCDSGPYALDDGQLMLFNDLVDLAGRHYPWGIPDALPFNQLSMAVVLKDAKIRIANAGLAYGRPPNFLEKTVRVAVYTSESGSLTWLGPDAWPQSLAAISSAQTQLYRKFTKMSSRDRVMAGTSTYFWFIRPITRFVQIDKELNWELLHFDRFYDRLAGPGVADELFDRALIQPREVPSSYTPFPN
jgi:hypothetical protein